MAVSSRLSRRSYAATSQNVELATVRVAPNRSSQKSRRQPLALGSKKLSAYENRCFERDQNIFLTELQSSSARESACFTPICGLTSLRALCGELSAISVTTRSEEHTSELQS